MQINTLYTNPYSKIYGQVSDNHVTVPKLNALQNSQDVFVKQQSSQVAFTGLFSGWFKEAPKVVAPEVEKIEKLAEKAAQEMSRRIRRYNDDPNLVIMSYFTKTPYTKENAYEFTKYLDSHNVDMYKMYDNPYENYGLWHKSVDEAIKTAGVFNNHGLEDAQNYSMHLLLRNWRHYNLFDGIGYYIAGLHLCPEDFRNLKEWIKWAIPAITRRDGYVWRDEKGLELYGCAINKKNIPLLKFLTEDLKLKPYDMSSHAYDNNCHEICTAGKEILKGREHKDPEIRQFFDDEHLYQLFLSSDEQNKLRYGAAPLQSTTYDIARHLHDDKGLALLMKAVINSEKGSFEKNIILNNIIKGLDSPYGDSEIRYILAAEFPVAPIERNMNSPVLRLESRTIGEYYPQYMRATAIRAENLFKKYAIDDEFTIDGLKKCLDDSVMSPEVLIQRGSKSSVLEEISKIQVDETNKADMKEIVQKIKDMKYLKYNWELLRDIASNAAEHSNADLLQFLKEMHIDLSLACRRFKKSSNVSNEVRQILSDVKSYEYNLVEYSHYNSVEAFRSFAKTKFKDIDVNSRDDNGSALLLEAAKNGNVDLIRELKNIPDVDWNITDSVGKNVLMHAIDYALKDPKKAEEIIDILKTLPKDKFDINYINYCANFIAPYPHTAIQYRLAHNLSGDLLKKLLEFPNADVNVHAPNSVPTAYIPCLNYKPEQLKLLIENSNIDTLAPYKGQTLRQHLFSWKLFPRIGSVSDAEPFERLLDSKANNIFVNKMKKIYDNEGTFTIEQINDFLNYGQIEKIKDKPINSIGERISHFIAEIFPDAENPDEVLELTKLFEKLKEKEVDLDALDEIGRSPMRKAIEADNFIVAKLFKDYGSKPSDIEEIKSLCKESDNPQIKELFV